MGQRMSDDDEIVGFGLAQLKREVTQEEMDLMMREAGKLWAVQRAAAEKAEQAKFLAVIAAAKSALVHGESIEAVVALVRDAYKPEDTMSDLDD